MDTENGDDVKDGLIDKCARKWIMTLPVRHKIYTETVTFRTKTMNKTLKILSRDCL